MAITVEIDSTNLRELLKHLESAPNKLRQALRDSVNDVGDEFRDTMIDELVEETGFAPSAASKFITVSRGTLSDPSYALTIAEGVLEDDLTRRGPTRDFQQRAESIFNQDMLVNVITAQDDAVCPICVAIAEEGPYSIAETREIRQRHPHFLNRDLNCRCALTPFKPQGRVTPAVTSGKGVSMNLQATLQKLVMKVAKEAGLALKIAVK